MISRLLLGLAGLAGALALKSKLATSPGKDVKAGDEVSVPLSALPGLNAPPGAGGAILAVESAGNETLLGRIVAFVGPGGTADVRTPIGPLVIARKDVSIVLAAPPDRVGRFADVGDDVAVDARDPAIAQLSRAQLLASAPAAATKGVTDADKLESVLVRVEKMSPTGLTGPVRGVVLRGPQGMKVASVSVNDATLAGAAEAREFSRGSILSVSRGGTGIAARNPTPAPQVAGAIVGAAIVGLDLAKG